MSTYLASCLQVLGEAVGSPLLQSQLLPAIVNYARDSVPNLRFNVAKALERLAPKIDASTAARVVKPALTTLSRDPDEDVRFYALRALAAIA